MAELHKFNFKDTKIPEISKKELNRRLSFISPCIKKDNEIIKMTDYGDPIKQSFSWNFKEGDVLGSICHNGFGVKDRPSEFGGWYLKQISETVGSFITLHRFAYYGFYKPSIEEVLSQLPEELFDEAKLAGRKLYFTNEMISSDINVSMLESEYHIAKTKVYIDKI